MKKIMLAALFCAAFPATAWTQVARVEAVQSPAWLERGGRAVPLAPGTALQPRDQLRTGANARVLMRLAEGSAVKLGEGARFTIERAETGGVFRAALSVIAGAFRFTTDPNAPARTRNVEIRAKNVTAGIRGTDLWGKATDDRDIVVLIEGRISVTAAGEAPIALERPLDMVQKPRVGAAQVVRIDQAQLEAFAAETELAADGPGAPQGGAWRVIASLQATRDGARALVREMRNAGYPAEVVTIENYFAAAVPNLGSEAQARAVMANLRAIPGVTLPKVEPTP